MKTATLFALTALLPALAAQDTTRGEPFVLAAGEIKLTEFVDRCANYLHWNVLSSTQELQSCPTQEIRTQQAISVDHDGCVDLLSTMLARGGFALTELDADKHLYEIIAVNGPRGREITNRAVRRTVEQVLARPTLRMPVTTVLELKNTNAMIAVNALRPFFASAGGASVSSLTIGTTGNPTTLLLSGLQDQVATAIQMVREGDVPVPPEVSGDGPVGRLEALERRVAALEKQLKALQGDDKDAKGKER